jgi:hypothetical protein
MIVMSAKFAASQVQRVRPRRREWTSNPGAIDPVDT